MGGKDKEDGHSIRKLDSEKTSAVKRKRITGKEEKKNEVVVVVVSSDGVMHK